VRKNRRKSWLKQLRVAVSTEASMPVGSSPQNSKTILLTCATTVKIFKKTNEDFLLKVYFIEIREQ
jgi:hypothetical protein